MVSMPCLRALAKEYDMAVDLKSTFITLKEESTESAPRRRFSVPGSMHLVLGSKITTRKRDASSISTSAETSVSEDDFSHAELSGSEDVDFGEDELAQNKQQKGDENKHTRASWADLSEDGDAGITTLMIRNIPPKYTQTMLLEEWQHNGTYDLLYLPYSDKKKRNSGYAFVNFVSEAEADSFKNKWYGARLAHFDRRKNLSVVPAAMQGYESIITAFGQKASPSNRDDDVQPVIWKNRCDEGTEKVTLVAALKD
jgi:hypothetical protein